MLLCKSRILPVLALLFVSTAAWANQSFECGDDTMTVPSSPAAGPSGTWRGLNVWARDSCGATTIPTNARLIWDTTAEHNMTRFLEDVSYGALHVYADDVFADDTSYKFILVDTTLRILPSVPDTCQLACLWRGSDSACNQRIYYNDIRPGIWSNRMKLFFRKIMEQVDARIDFSEYDLNGPDGVPDTIVDFVNF